MLIHKVTNKKIFGVKIGQERMHQSELMLLYFFLLLPSLCTTTVFSGLSWFIVYYNSKGEVCHQFINFKSGKKT